jgi:hypothetical protein
VHGDDYFGFWVVFLVVTGGEDDELVYVLGSDGG